VPAISKANTKDISTTRATTRVAPTIGAVVGAFKSITTIFYARGVKKFNWPKLNGHLWQRNYYEHIIRSENSLRHIQEYICNNPLQCAFDRDNPVNILQEK
jgi:putative transposase